VDRAARAAPGRPVPGDGGGGYPQKDVRDGGPRRRGLALRPDFTIPVCLEHLRNGGGSERYAYEGVVFRRHDSGAPERLETGYEDIGRVDRARADAEALALAVAGVASVVPGPLQVRLGDIGSFGALLRALGLPGRWRRRLRHSFGLPAALAANLERLSPPRERQDERLDAEIRAAAHGGPRGLEALLAERAAAQGLGVSVGRSPAEIAERFLDGRALPDAELAARAVATLRQFLGLHADLPEATARLTGFAARAGVDLGEGLSFFAERAAEIARLVPSASIRFEAGFGRPLDYYTGLVFEIVAAEAQTPICGGGRYDRLMEMLGAETPIPAVGFTMRLDMVRGAP
jgi:ATP phosphoribosyltransferase regulatory subunit